MFGLRKLFRREIRKAFSNAISALQKPKTTTIKTQSVVQQVQVTTATATQTTTHISQSQVIRGKCHVIDGDTIAIGKQKIRQKKETIKVKESPPHAPVSTQLKPFTLPSSINSS